MVPFHSRGKKGLVVVVGMVKNPNIPTEEDQLKRSCYLTSFYIYSHVNESQEHACYLFPIGYI